MGTEVVVFLLSQIYLVQKISEVEEHLEVAHEQ